MAIYGLQPDINASPSQNINLFTPGKTQLTAQDVFLGGTGTGVSDSMIGQATRVFGDTTKGTAQALTDYNQNLSSQIGAAQVTNAAPRVDANLGMPTMARLAMELGQAQNSVSNNLARDTYNHGVSQDNFTNTYNVGKMMGSYGGVNTMDQNQNNFTNGLSVGKLMGNYNGADTLAKKSQDIQDAQYKADLAQKESQYGRTLASDNANKSADRSISQQNANSASNNASSADVKSWLQQALSATGQDSSLLPYLATIVQHESSGNPNAQNNWDSNAQKGTPSKGLMQTIDSTFAKYSAANHKDIWNPVDNAIAAINYAVARYGSLGNVPGIKSLANGGKYIGY
jgi:hypothetical protein